MSPRSHRAVKALAEGQSSSHRKIELFSTVINELCRFPPRFLCKNEVCLFKNSQVSIAGNANECMSKWSNRYVFLSPSNGHINIGLKRSSWKSRFRSHRSVEGVPLTPMPAGTVRKQPHGANSKIKSVCNCPPASSPLPWKIRLLLRPSSSTSLPLTELWCHPGDVTSDPR